VSRIRACLLAALLAKVTMCCMRRINKVFACCSALYIGKLSDKIGRFPCFVGAMCAEMVAPVFLALRVRDTEGAILLVDMIQLDPYHLIYG
jgi:MFS-type transporter involved in bile tolerance (Atg22 family)